MANLKVDVGEVVAALRVLTRGIRDAVFELRVVEGGRNHRETASGYFTIDSLDRAANHAARLNGTAATIGWCLNPVTRALHARAADRIELPAKHATKDTDIEARVWLMVDVDPRRPSGVSSTDSEHQTALKRAREIRDHLLDLKWPPPILADSGNGAHLLVPCREPNDEATRNLFETVLKGLYLRFTDNVVSVDQSTFNAARCGKVYGTWACKGDSTPERPHRRSRILELPAIATPDFETELTAPDFDQ